MNATSIIVIIADTDWCHVHFPLFTVKYVYMVMHVLYMWLCHRSGYGWQNDAGNSEAY